MGQMQGQQSLSMEAKYFMHSRFTGLGGINTAAGRLGLVDVINATHLQVVRAFVS
jgi:hypothetical protein